MNAILNSGMIFKPGRRDDSAFNPIGTIFGLRNESEPVHAVSFYMTDINGKEQSIINFDINRPLDPQYIDIYGKGGSYGRIFVERINGNYIITCNDSGLEPKYPQDTDLVHKNNLAFWIYTVPKLDAMGLSIFVGNYVYGKNDKEQHAIILDARFPLPQVNAAGLLDEILAGKPNRVDQFVHQLIDMGFCSDLRWASHEEENELLKLNLLKR